MQIISTLRHARLLLVLGALSLFFGCQSESPSSLGPTSAGTTSDGSAEARETDPASEMVSGEIEEGPGDDQTANVASTDISAQLAGFDEIMAFVAASKGKVVVLDVWSTQCIPCMREFPNLVKLSEQQPDGVQCVSLNVDYIGLKSRGPETYVPKVEKFLTGQKATFKNFVATATDEAIRDQLKIYSIPAILVYSPDGKLAATLTDSNASGDGLSYEADVIPLVQKLLAAAK